MKNLIGSCMLTFIIATMSHADGMACNDIAVTLKGSVGSVAYRGSVLFQGDIAQDSGSALKQALMIVKKDLKSNCPDSMARVQISAYSFERIPILFKVIQNVGFNSLWISFPEEHRATLSGEQMQKALKRK